MPLIYRMILFTAVKWDSFRVAWYWAQTPMLKAMSGLLAVRCSKLPMMLLYKVGLTSISEGSRLSLVDEFIGVEACFLESSPNFLTRFLAYCSCEMNMPSFLCLTWRPKKNVSYPTILISISFFIYSKNSIARASMVALNAMSSTYTWATRR